MILKNILSVLKILQCLTLVHLWLIICSMNRQKSIDLIRSVNSECKVILITSDNLADYVLPEHPLHPSYEKLSYIQRSDYLRAYLMHHHGGVYMDIKPMDKPWLPLLEELNATPDMWVIAPHEINSKNASPASSVLGKDQRNYYKSVVNMSAFGCNRIVGLPMNGLLK